MSDLRETVHSFGPERRLVGVLTRRAPGAEEGGGPAVVILNAGIIHRTGPNRLHVRIARRLAARGVPTLRFDLPGIGDSGMLGTAGSTVDDALAAVTAALDELGRLETASRFVVFGLCSGADLAFMSASMDPRIAGVVLIDPNRIFPTWKSRLIQMLRPALRPSVWYRAATGRYGLVRRLLDRLRPAPEDPSRNAGAGPGGTALPSPAEIHGQVRAALASFVERGVQMLYIVTRHYRDEYVYARQFHDAFPGIELDAHVRVEIMPDAHHTFTTESSREGLEETVEGWIVETFDAVAENPAGTVAA